MRQKRPREEPCPVCKHYHNHEEGEVCQECGHVPETRHIERDPAFPSAVVGDWLFVGSYPQACSSEILKLIGITDIINMVPSIQNLYTTVFKYHVMQGPVLPLFLCVELIESLRQGGSKVFVHCMTGRSKSVVAVAAYLVAAFGVTPSVAVEEIKRAHPATNVTEEHQQLLAEFSAAWAQSPKFPPINGVA